MKYLTLFWFLVFSIGFFVFENNFAIGFAQNHPLLGISNHGSTQFSEPVKTAAEKEPDFDEFHKKFILTGGYPGWEHIRKILYQALFALIHAILVLIVAVLIVKEIVRLCRRKK